MMLKYIKNSVMTLLIAVVFSPLVQGQNFERDYDNEDENYYADKVLIDRYLDVDIWTNHSDGEFYEGDNIVIKFRANREAFVIIYSIDTQGRLNLLFPSGEDGNNFVEGGVTYSIPGGDDEYDLEVTGPEGVENLQIIASRERIPVPDWYPNSGLICDWDERNDFMDYVNGRYFVRYEGQRFAYDRTVLYINEWEEYYFRPVYYPYYPSWTVAGNIYIDYPFGSSIYINGIYWGCAPLYIPRLYVGWHTFTVYDRYGYCWESDVHIYRYNTVVLDRDVINTRPGVTSKYKDVRYAGYRNPVSSGYPNYKAKVARLSTSTKSAITTSQKTKIAGTIKTNTDLVTPTKRYSRGVSKIVKTDRGYETVAKVTRSSNKSKGASSYEYSKPSQSTSSSSKAKEAATTYDKTSKSTRTATKSTTGKKGYTTSKKQSKSGSSTYKETSKSKEYYQKKSGSKYKTKTKSTSSKTQKKSTNSQKSSKSYQSTKSSGSSGGAVKSSPSVKSTSSSKSAPKSSGSSKGRKK